MESVGRVIVRRVANEVRTGSSSDIDIQRPMALGCRAHVSVEHMRSQSCDPTKGLCE